MTILRLHLAIRMLRLAAWLRDTAANIIMQAEKARIRR
jgi:hypothetical protein